MPIFSGRFFKVLIGARPEPLWRLLSKVGLLYALEPVLTVIFVTNPKICLLRAQIFRRVLIQKVEFFDQYKGIAIARSLLKNAPILILDEASSALDAVSECLVQDALNHLMKGRTILVIAHQLSTVQNAHQIALCSDGRIAEFGTHFEVLARKGQYASLVGTQRLAF